MSGESLEEKLHKEFTDDYMKGLIYMLYSMAERFFSQCNLQNKVYLDEDILGYCLRDILVDLSRIRPFHDIEYLNLVKIYAYSASWWIRRKPFQRIESRCVGENLYVNEKFALFLLFHAMELKKRNINGKNNAQMVEHINQIMYHLKYRNLNPQTIELMIDGFNMGCLCEG